MVLHAQVILSESIQCLIIFSLHAAVAMAGEEVQKQEQLLVAIAKKKRGEAAAARANAHELQEGQLLDALAKGPSTEQSGMQHIHKSYFHATYLLLQKYVSLYAASTVR